jgi:hypothetical protein
LLYTDRMKAEDDALLRFAIEDRRFIRFTLHGHERVGEPHDYGVRDGKEQLLVYQVGGTSSSGKLPGWRMVVLAEATDFVLLEDRFAGGRGAASVNHKEWDRVFARVAPAPPGGVGSPGRRGA